MTNYLNQIESDLYKLYSITNGSGEVVEMVTELTEKYEKAKAWDRTQELLKECTQQTPGDDYEVDWHEFEMKIDDIINKHESGESDA
ncbi:hypothetical protein [Jeotgalicoccus halotolerans]|uniref:Uncharacterized protein n=1 Tax=Jeotgalicoccus halotolerans TaxID=157227 RepID=A0A3E0B2C3_9STAP|nr:hypothetical protein [Jeotgalicoccus halotolerans]REG25282.1 hypothetical protein DFR63_0308 [Jeotgalicoccus halotolerans]